MIDTNKNVLTDQQSNQCYNFQKMRWGNASSFPKFSLLFVKSSKLSPIEITNVFESLLFSSIFERINLTGPAWPNDKHSNWIEFVVILFVDNESINWDIVKLIIIPALVPIHKVSLQTCYVVTWRQPNLWARIISSQTTTTTTKIDFFRLKRKRGLIIE